MDKLALESDADASITMSDWTPDFIIDGPAGEDVLRSHAPLAAALVRVVREGKARLIGVLGDWGSGKSTIMHMVEMELRALPTPITCFSFDAWKHQSDPQRRAFLENLIAAIEKEERFSDLEPSIEVWRTRIDRLNRAREESEQQLTPRLNPWAAVFGFGLVLLPLSLRLIGDGTLSPEDARDPAAALFFALGWAGVALPILVAGHFFLRHRKAAEGSGVWALLANKPAETRAEVRIRDPEPSAIEFQGLFRDIMEAAQTNGRRLLVIVDNLDRLPAAEAVTVWASVRALFLGTDGGRSEGPGAPTIVMPLDPSAVEKLHARPDGRPDSAAVRSFLEKTFDVVFHVPKPVLSRRHAYLRERLDAVFRHRLTPDELHDVGSVFERQIGETGETPGPRQINSFVNALAVLAMQRGSEPIPLTIMAFFVARREETANIRKCVEDHGPYLATLHDDWRRALAALHFGVSLDLAQELFIDEPLRDAIRRRDDVDFAEFAAMEGFGRILLHNLDQALDGRVELQPLAAAELLAAYREVGSQGDAWLPDAWSKLRQLSVEMLARSAFASADLPGLSALIASAPESQRGAFASAAARAFGDSNDTLATADGIKAFAEAARLLDDAARKSRIEQIDLPVPNGFEGASAILVAELPPRLLKRLRFQVEDSRGWPRFLAERVGDAKKNQGPRVAAVVAALGRLGPDRDWSPLVEALDQQLGADTVGKARPAFETLFAIAESSPRAREQLIAGGRQINREVAFGNLWHEGGHKGLEEAVAFQLVTGGALLIAGEAWEQRLERSGELAERILQRLERLELDIGLPWLQQRLETFPHDRPLLARLALLRFASPDAPWPELIAHPEKALTLLPETDQPAFWARVLARNEVAQHLGSWPADVSARILEQAAKSEPRTDIRAWVAAALGTRPAALWKDVIESGAQPYSLATSIDWLGAGREDLGRAAFEALTETAATVLSTSSAPYRHRWFGLEALLSPSRRGALRKRLVRGLLEHDLSSAQLLQLLPPLESSLGQSSYVFNNADQATRRILTPLARDPLGRKWLTEHPSYVTAWFRRSEESTREMLRSGLRRAAQNGDRAARSLLALLHAQPGSTAS